MHRFWQQLQRERGLISLFLTGVLLLTSMTTAILTDYARYEVGRAELRDALRVTSHAVLSGFDKGMAHDFGVYALSDVESGTQLAHELLPDRWEAGGEAFRWVHPDLMALDIVPVPLSRLSRPEALQEQITGFMDWQIPSLLISKVNAHFQLLHHAKDVIGVIASKLDYEKKLHDVQTRLNAVAEKMQSLAEWQNADPASEDPVFSGLPSLSSDRQEVEELLASLDEDLAATMQKAAEGAAKIPASAEEWMDLLSPTLLLDLNQKFSHLTSSYLTTESRLQQLGGLEQDLQARFSQTKEDVDGLEGAENAWKSALNGLPKGFIATEMMGDFLAVTGSTDIRAIEDLEKEVGEVLRNLPETKDAWASLTADGQRLSDLSFSQWLQSRLKKMKSDASGQWTLPAVDLQGKPSTAWEQDHLLSEEAMRTQKSLVTNAKQDRSSLLEFLQAWNTKRKARVAALQAERAGLSNLSGGIGTFLSTQQLARYQEDASGESFQNLTLVQPGEDSAMIQSAFEAVTQIAEENFSYPLATLEENMKLLGYWTGMFSHRITPKLIKEKAAPPVSLTGQPLAQRPVYGGELEYILLGKSQWMENVRQVEYRIAGIRLLLNLLYAFTSSSLNMVTIQIATALAGWTGFAVPYVQSALLTLLAIGETKLDMDALLSGETIAAWKSEDSWRFSLGGVRTLAADVTSDLLDFAEDQTTSAVEATAEMAQEKIIEIASAARQKWKDVVRQPALRIVTQLLLEPGIKDQAEYADRLQKSFEQLAQSLSDQGTQMQAHAAFANLAAQSQSIADVLINALNEKEQAGEVTQEVLQSLQNKVNGIIDSLEAGTSSLAEEASQTLVKGISNVRTSAENEMNHKLEAVFQDFENRMGMGTLASELPLQAGFQMHYGDYINLLLVLTTQLPAGKRTMLSHTASLIQAETGNQTDLTTAPTALHWTLKADIPAVFLSWISDTNLADEAGNMRLSEEWEEGYGMFAREKVP